MKPPKNKAAQELGHLGGKAKSIKKSEAARQNWQKALHSLAQKKERQGRPCASDAERTSDSTQRIPEESSVVITAATCGKDN